jgi:IclR family KDG regulon transcriptional repressor
MVAKDATALRRGLQILFALADDGAANGGALGVIRLAELVGKEKSQVSRSLKVLAEYGLVARDPTTLRYRLGWRFFALAAQAGDRSLLVAAAPLLKRLVDDFDETAHLSLLDGADVMTVLSEPPKRAVQAAGWIGRSVPVHCTSSGRALLFDHELAELRQLLRGVAFGGAGPNAPASLEELFERVVVARERGFALVDEEFEPGLVAAGAPVRDFRGRVIAAVNVSGPKFRFANRLEAAGEAVKRAAEELSAELGSPGGGGRR